MRARLRPIAASRALRVRVDPRLAAVVALLVQQQLGLVHLLEVHLLVGGGVLARYGDLAALQVPLRGPPAARLQGHGRVQEALLGRRQPALLSGSSDEMPSVVERQIVLLHVW